jgi:hypothetical protein
MKDGFPDVAKSSSFKGAFLQGLVQRLTSSSVQTPPGVQVVAELLGERELTV